ncbi:globin family protein [Flexivirga alba]|uniref:Globin family protein n=1 Tax=Flexivirga alba TaxID=702742 RepID=A0ABW2AF28_9MICO
MDQRQIHLVQSTFAQVAPIADQASSIFYDKLFELDPSLRALFPADITEQRQKLMKTLGFAVNGLSDWTAAAPAVRSLGARHVGYGALPSHYATVGSALISTLDVGLGAAFTPEVREAWVACLGLVSSAMRDAAADELAS